MVVYTNLQVAAAALEAGGLDILEVGQFDLAVDLEGKEGIVVDTAALTGTGYTLCYNAMDEETSNQLFREVAYKVFEEQALIKVITLTEYGVAYIEDLEDADVYKTRVS